MLLNKRGSTHKNLSRIFLVKSRSLLIKNSVYYFQLFVHSSSTVCGNFSINQAKVCSTIQRFGNTTNLIVGIHGFQIGKVTGKDTPQLAVGCEQVQYTAKYFAVRGASFSLRFLTPLESAQIVYGIYYLYNCVS